MKNKLVLLSVLTHFLLLANDEKKYSQQEYISMWKDIAVQQMNEYKIPASITLAQGILESGFGNSLLAKEANNHFGIKCSDWKGETFYKDNNECYRKYKNAKKSYEDHSLFLTTRSHYEPLFKLKITDYKAWAKGLKEAGYATSSSYPTKLIDIIEKLKLYELDGNYLDKSSNEDKSKNDEGKNSNQIEVIKTLTNKHEIKTHVNNIKYIEAKKGDTYYRISKEFGIGMWQLYRYNDFHTKKDYLIEGDIIYLQPKKRKNKKTKNVVVKEDLTLRMLAQKEGVKIQRLKKINAIENEDDVLAKGSKIKLK